MIRHNERESTMDLVQDFVMADLARDHKVSIDVVHETGAGSGSARDHADSVVERLAIAQSESESLHLQELLHFLDQVSDLDGCLEPRDSSQTNVLHQRLPKRKKALVDTICRSK